MLDGNDYVSDCKPIVIVLPVQQVAWGATTLKVRTHGPTLARGIVKLEIEPNPRK